MGHLGPCVTCNSTAESGYEFDISAVDQNPKAVPSESTAAAFDMNPGESEVDNTQLLIG